MVSKVVRPLNTKFNQASRPVVVTDHEKFWVEDPPNLARTLPVESEEGAVEIWDKMLTASRPKMRCVRSNRTGEYGASNRH